MEIAITIILLIIGIVLIVKGGDVFVDAASWMAEASGIPKLIVGATVVSFATTLPELLVSMFAAADGKVDMSIGNAVGSVTANIGLILAIAMIFMPAKIRRRDYWLKTLLMIGAAVVIVIFGQNGEFSLTASMFLLTFFIISMASNVIDAVRGIKKEKLEKVVEDETETGEPIRKIERRNITKSQIMLNIAKFVIGAVMIVFGAQLLVDNGSELAKFIGIPERVIGVTIVAVGTSLPELVTTLTAIRKKEHSLSAGNILGANIIDLALIMPLSALVSGGSLTVTQTVAIIDLPACLIVCTVAMLPALLLRRFSRWQGFLILALYTAYVVISSTGLSNQIVAGVSGMFA